MPKAKTNSRTQYIDLMLNEILNYLRQFNGLWDQGGNRPLPNQCLSMGITNNHSPTKCWSTKFSLSICCQPASINQLTSVLENCNCFGFQTNFRSQSWLFALIAWVPAKYLKYMNQLLNWLKEFALVQSCMQSLHTTHHFVKYSYRLLFWYILQNPLIIHII